MLNNRIFITKYSDYLFLEHATVCDIVEKYPSQHFNTYMQMKNVCTELSKYAKNIILDDVLKANDIYNKVKSNEFVDVVEYIDLCKKTLRKSLIEKLIVNSAKDIERKKMLDIEEIEQEEGEKLRLYNNLEDILDEEAIENIFMNNRYDPEGLEEEKMMQLYDRVETRVLHKKETIKSVNNSYIDDFNMIYNFHTFFSDSSRTDIEKIPVMCEYIKYCSHNVKMLMRTNPTICISNFHKLVEDFDEHIDSYYKDRHLCIPIYKSITSLVSLSAFNNKDNIEQTKNYSDIAFNCVRNFCLITKYRMQCIGKSEKSTVFCVSKLSKFKDTIDKCFLELSDDGYLKLSECLVMLAHHLNVIVMESIFMTNRVYSEQR